MLFIFAAPMPALAELTQPAPQEGLALEGAVGAKRVFRAICIVTACAAMTTACCWRMPRSAGRQKAAFGSMVPTAGPAYFSFTTDHSDISVFILGQSMLTKTKAANCKIYPLPDAFGAQALRCINVATAGDQNMVDYVKTWLGPKFDQLLIPASRCG